MNAPDADPELLAQIVDEWQARIRKGETPDLNEYVEKYPGIADDLRDLLPGLAALQELRGDALDQTVAPPPRTDVDDDGPTLDQMGDYRILREIGRGGMGVVYEAEQISLGRRVALKVLPSKVLVDSRQRRRFAREARAAARLHHTNIVPVFGVGDHDGLPYYVMQFIQGLGLDVVLKEVRQVRLGAEGPNEPAEAQTLTRSAVSAANVARSLITGAFRPTAGVPDPDRTGPREPSSNSGSGSGSQDGPISGSFAGPGSSVIIPGQDGKPGRGKAHSQSYWQSVAAIGLQVAGALDHAHQQGILHRDIKPSNLLLDTRGTVWVTDFGLAKAADHQDDLTGTGDILGTLRYMPPEAFEGRSDARSDIYALGLTLYELVALKPAFDERDRHRLIKQVTDLEAPRLDRLAPDVPRDLATIIHKAIEKDPARRYANSGDLADDLQRFVNDEPIKARPITLTERFVRWSRHNKGLAAALGGVAALLLLSTVVSVIAMGYFWRQEQLQERVAAQQTELAAQQAQVAETNARLLVITEREREDARHSAEEQARLKTEALAAQKQAEANYRLAVSAVDQLLNKVTAEPILAGPGLQPVRKKLLQSALPFLETFAQQRRDDPASRADLADARSRIARVVGEIGSPKEAVGHLEQSIEARTELLASQPAAPDQRMALARDRELLGELYLKLNDPGKAEQALAAAHAAWTADPADPAFRSGAARVLGLQGDAAWADGESVIALDRYNKALSALTALDRDHADHPDAVRFRLQLAQAMGRFAGANVRLRQLSGTYASVGTTKTPGDFCREAVTLLEGLVKGHPQHDLAAEFHRELARTKELLGDFEEAQKNWPAALVAYQQAGEIRARLATENPLTTDYLADWARNLAATSALHARQGNLPLAMTTLSEAVEKQRAALKAAPEATSYIVALAGQLVAQGHLASRQDDRAAASAAYVEASTLLESLTAPSREDLYAAAVARAWAARLCVPATGEPTPEQKTLRDQHTAAAVTGLEKAIAAGFLDLETLSSDTAFAALKDDERFNKLVAGLADKLKDWKWHTDLEAARALARESGKSLLVYFSGSDWCIWCIVVRKGVLGREEFLREAAKQYVLVNLDTLRYSPPLPNDSTNKEMKRRWRVSNFPSFFVCDPELRRVTDLQKDRPRVIPDWIRRLKEIHDLRVSRDEALAAARNAELAERNRILAAAFKDLPLSYLEDYGEDVVQAVLTASIDQAPDNPEGYQKRASLFLSRQDWKAALPDLLRLIDLQPTNTENWIQTAEVCLKAGDLESYHQLCQTVLDRSADNPTSQQARRAARVLLIGPPAPDKLPAVASRIDPLLNQQAVLFSIHWVQLNKALADYRAGNDRSALEWVQKTLAVQKNPPSLDAQACLVKALAHQRLGEHEAAYDAWVRARFILDSWARMSWPALHAQDWPEILFSQRLATEAETALKDNPTLARAGEARQRLDTAVGWTVLNPFSMRSEAGAQLTLQPDGSVLASGEPVPVHDTYTLEFDVPAGRPTALRLEALTHASLPGKGPGRSVQGDFVLSEITASLKPKGSWQPVVPVSMTDAVASHEEVGYAPKQAVDGDLGTGWAIFPRVGESHWVVFPLKLPASAANGGKLTLTLQFQHPNWMHYVIGRLRLSVTSQDGVMIASQGLSRLYRDPRLASVLAAEATAQAIAGDPAKAAELFARALDRAADPAARLRVARLVLDVPGALEAVGKLRPKEPALFLALAGKHREAGDVKQEQATRTQVREIYEALLAEHPDSEERATVLADFLGEGQSRDWNVVEPYRMISNGRASLTTQPDGSILVSGTNPDKDIYTLYAPARLKRITAVRLETLPDPSLPGGGAGRAPETGNFALSQFRMGIYAPPTPPRSVGLATAISDHAVPAGQHYDKKDMRITLTLDQKSDTHWEGWPSTTQPHWAIFRLAQPVSLTPGSEVMFRLEFQSLIKHGLGRFRISVSDRDDPSLTGGMGASPNGFARLGESYLMLGDTARAAAAFARALDKADAPSSRSQILTMAMAEDGALTELARIRPEDLSVQLTLARSHAGAGRAREADAAFARAAMLSRDLYPSLEAGWWTSGPFPADNTLDDPLPPGESPDPSRPVPGTWRAVASGPSGRMDPPVGSNNHSWLALTYVHSREDRTATLLVSGEGLRIWINGRTAYLNTSTAAGAATLFVRVPVALKAGRNVLLLKANGSTSPHVRFADDPLTRANDLARVGLYREAAEASRQGIAGTTDHHALRLHALLLLLAGDREGYRAFCKELETQYGTANDLAPALTVGHVASLDLEPALPAERLVGRTEQGASLVKQPWAQFEVALALHRAGKHEQALARLNAVPELQEWPKVWVLRALIVHRQGFADEARTWLQKAGDWYDAAVRATAGSSLSLPFNPGWWEQARFQLLYQQARQISDRPDWTDANRDVLASRTRSALRPDTHDHDLAVLLAPTDARLRLARGARLLELNRPEEARAEFDEAVRLRPKDVQIWRVRGRVEAEYGHLEQAAGAISRYLDLLPVEEHWHSPRSRACVELAGQPELYDRLMALRPKDTLLPVALARRHGYHGRWKEAAAILGPVTEARAIKEECYELAAFLLLAGDVAGYEKAVRRLVERGKAAKDPNVWYTLARACILVPRSPVDAADVVRWAEAAIAADPKAWFLHVLAAAHYRAGRYSEAMKRVVESESAPWGDWGQSQNAVLRALLLAEQGNTAAARTSLSRARDLVDRATANGPSPLVRVNPDFYEYQLLYREAEARLREPGKEKPKN